MSSNSLNTSTLVGRVVRDIQLRYTPANKAVVNTTIAVKKNYKSANGETESDFIPIVIWGKSAENFANWATKGTLISMSGALGSRNYDNADGQKVYVIELIVDSWSVLESKEVINARRTSTGNPATHQATHAQAGSAVSSVTPDELTFNDPAALASLQDTVQNIQPEDLPF